MKNLHVLLSYFFIFVILLGCTREEGVFAEINTSKGKITAFLEFEKVPLSVANFVGLAEGTIENATYSIGTPYYDGSVIHRVEEGHVIQGGSPPGENNKGTGYRFPNEIHPDLSHDKAGMLNFANGGPHTNSDQWCITLGDRSYLDGDYIVFGHVTEGMDVLYSIEKGDVFESINITRIGKKAKAFQPNTEMFEKLIEKQWEKVNKLAQEKKDREESIVQERWPDAVVASAGYRYKVIKEGQGEKVKAGSIVNVQYKGELFNGQKFVSSSGNGNPSFGENAQLFAYELGESHIVAALDDAIKDMKVGETRVLIVPSDLAFGRGGFYGKNIPGSKRFVISPNTTIIYELEIVEQ